MSPDDVLNAARGCIVSHVWFGDFKSMYIELGSLAPPKRVNPQGEVTLYVGYHWQVSGTALGIEKLDGTEILGAVISNIEVQGSSELLVEFSNGVRLVTRRNVEEPEWCVTLRDLAHLSIAQGALLVEQVKS